MTPMAHDVFISYASQDKSIADAICGTLEGRKVRCWIAPRDIVPGVPYAEALSAALRSSRVLVLVLSKHSNGSQHVMREVEAAVNAGVTLVPFQIENMSLSLSLNYLLKSIHWLDALKPPLEQHVNTLADVVQGLLNRAAPVVSARARGTDPSICLPSTPFVSVAQKPVGRRWLIPALVAGITAPLVMAGTWWLLRTDRVAGGPSTAANKPEEQVTYRSPDPNAAFTPAVVRLEGRARLLPAAEVLKVVYEDAPPAGTAKPGPLKVQVGLYGRREGEAFHPLADGDSLASQVDRYWIGIRPMSDGYLYVFQVDSQGKADWLFPANPRQPASTGNNPVKASDILQIPPGDAKALYLDTHIGTEYLYVVFSASRWPALEEALSRPSPPTPAVPPIFEDRPLVSAIHRGVGGTTDEDPPAYERVTGEGRKKMTLAARTYEGNGLFLVVERRFRHVDR
jgi:hypothetical protein